jgi:dTDP-4-amino-4,6-dideoxygalactose transaminase
MIIIYPNRQRYANVQAVLGLRGLARLDDFNVRARQHALRYTRGLADCRLVQTPRVLTDVEHVYYQYCIYVSHPAIARRRAIRRRVDFETTHVDVCPSLWLFKEFAAECPGAQMTEQALQLPVYSRLRQSDIERVLNVVRCVVGDFKSFDGRDPATARDAAAGDERHAKAS